MPFWELFLQTEFDLQAFNSLNYLGKVQLDEAGTGAWLWGQIWNGVSHRAGVLGNSHVLFAFLSPSCLLEAAVTESSAACEHCPEAFARTLGFTSCTPWRRNPWHCPLLMKVCGHLRLPVLIAALLWFPRDSHWFETWLLELISLPVLNFSYSVVYLKYFY